MIALYTLILSLFVTIALLPLLVRVAGDLRLVDLPDDRKLHQGAVPCVGGIAIAAGVLSAALLFLSDRAEINAYLAAVSVIFLLGVADDRFDLNYRLKFLGQIAGALVLVVGGDLWLTRLPFTYDVSMPDWIGIPLTMLLIVGVTNAINLADGMDGLAGGTSLLAASALGYLAYLGGDKQVALLALALIGATLGFLRYNTFPARVFMGDGGSQFLGFSVAVLGILLVERSNTAISPLVPVLVLGLPIVDTLSVMIRRLRSGQSPFQPDRRHLHHRLLDLGLNPYQSVVLIYLLQALLILAAWRLQYAPDWMLLAVLILFLGGLFWVLHLWQTQHTHGRMLLQRLDVITRAVEFARAERRLTRFARFLLVYGLAGFLLVGALLVGEVGQDIGWLAILLGLMLLLSILVRSFPLHGAARLATFVLGASVIYLTETQGLVGGLSESWMRIWLALIALGIALELRFGGGGFHVNTLDVLVILIIAVVPNMPLVRELGLRAMVVEILVLFYASELALDDYGERRWNLLHVAALFGLGVIALRAFIAN